MTTFNNPALKQLADQQVRFAPASRRQEQMERAERLLEELDPNRRYPYQFVCFRITDFRPTSYPDLMIEGSDLTHDLPLLVEALAPTIEGDEGENDPFVTLDEAGRQLGVSTKTIRRWRRHGLVGQRLQRHGKMQLGFRQSVIERFVAAHPDRVQRGRHFSQMTDAEREEILLKAKDLAQAGGSLTEVSRKLADRLHRSPEAIRYTIKNFDREHPELALFPESAGPLDSATKQSIYSSYRKGIKVNTLAKQYHRTRTSMYRVINEIRAKNLLEQPLDYIAHESFDDPALEAEILAPMPDAEDYEAKRLSMKAPKDVPPELASLYEWPLLKKEQEQHLFRQMNYLKYKACKLRDEFRKEGGDDIDPTRVRIQKLKEIEDLQNQSNEVKDLLINANMRLVVNIAKRHAAQTDNLFELLSDGNMSLIRAVEKFDFGRGFKFSTYASWAIMKNFARSIPDEKNRRDRFVTGHDDVFDASPDTRSDEYELLATQERATKSVNRLLQHLEPREREIIRMRAGLDDHARNMTLEEIGKQFGITKERVRQLNARAMKKLRSIAEDEDFDLL